MWILYFSKKIFSRGSSLPFLVSSPLFSLALLFIDFHLISLFFPPFPLLLTYCSFSQCYYFTSRARTEINWKCLLPRNLETEINYSFEVPEPIVPTSSCGKNWHLHFKSRKPCWRKFHLSDPTLQPLSYTLQKPAWNQHAIKWDVSTPSTGSSLNDQWIDSSLSGRPCYLFQWCTRSHNNWAARRK